MDLDVYINNYWMVRLLLNVLGYATIIVPGFLIVYYVRHSGFLATAGNGWFAGAVRLFVEGSDPTVSSLPDNPVTTEVEHPKSTTSIPKQTTTQQSLQLILCSAGLLGSYLIWGLLQERIMAFDYSSSKKIERFTDSQFLVFMNRILALIVAVAAITVQCSLSKQQPPLYKYSYGSFSNIMSSWCQYEALKFVSFPVQVLAKASKVIPVMLMGRVVFRRSYTWSDYGTAVLLSAGLFTFLLTSTNQDQGHHGLRGQAATTLSGLVILTGYLVFDSFTSNWQSELFRTYQMSSLEMMAGVNLFSVLLTATSLIQQGSFVVAVDFASRHPQFVFHVIILSATSAFGQLFIFYTIAQFGAVTFTIVMTVRQGLAILLSCIVYQHAVSVTGMVGIFLVFLSIFARIYISYTQRKTKARGHGSGPNAV